MIYRDRLTGKFAAKTTWTRSHAQGGTRYVRQSIAKGMRHAEPVKAGEREGGAAGKLPPPSAIKTARDYSNYYDDFGDYEDQGEVESSVDY